MTVRELLERIDSHELTEWMAFFRVEPFGPGRSEWRAGTIAATVANVNRSKGQRPFRPEDFFPELMPPGPQQTAEEQKEILLAMFGKTAKKVNRKDG